MHSPWKLQKAHCSVWTVEGREEGELEMGQERKKKEIMVDGYVIFFVITSGSVWVFFEVLDETCHSVK